LVNKFIAKSIVPLWSLYNNKNCRFKTCNWSHFYTPLIISLRSNIDFKYATIGF